MRRPAVCLIVAVCLCAILSTASVGTANAASPTAKLSSPVAAKVLSASDLSFGRTVLHADVPVLVAFWSSWCIPCREMETPLASLAARLGNRARVVRVNFTWSPFAARRYGVQALPTLLVFQHGELVSRLTGGASVSDLEDLMSNYLQPQIALSR
jgi:thioredoxin-like negative regulator of GroEL